MKLDVDVSFRDILDRLDLAIMGVVEVPYGEWRLAADVLWASLSDTVSRDTLLGPVKTKLDLTQVVADFLAGRRVFSQPATWLPWSRRIDDPRRLDIDLFAGARLGIRVQLGLFLRRAWHRCRPAESHSGSLSRSELRRLALDRRQHAEKKLVTPAQSRAHACSGG